jgi:hypothetical protein
MERVVVDGYNVIHAQYSSDFSASARGRSGQTRRTARRLRHGDWAEVTVRSTRTIRAPAELRRGGRGRDSCSRGRATRPIR